MAQNEFHLKLAIGDIPAEESGGASLTLKTWLDAELTESQVEDLGVPEDCDGTWVYLDLTLHPEFDEDEVADLCGQLDLAIAAIPWQEMLPPNLHFYHSHAVDLVEAADGAAILRIALFSKLHAAVLARQVAAGRAGIPVEMIPENRELLDENPAEMDFRFAVPISVDDVFNPETVFSLDMLRTLVEFRMTMDTEKFRAAADAAGGELFLLLLLSCCHHHPFIHFLIHSLIIH